MPTSGSIELEGKDVTGMAPFERDLNTVFQDYALFPHMSLIDNVAYGLRVRGMARKERNERAREALERVQLGKFVGRKPAQLSGGQRQRVALAGRWWCSPRSCCWTSRWAPWTSSSGSRCRWNSRICSARSASPSSSSPTTRRRP